MIYLQITSGRGPAECEIAVRHILNRMVDDQLVRVETETLGSAVVSFADEHRDYANRWIGTILWICPSPIRKHHGRKNWYVGIREIELPDEKPVVIREEDLVWESKGASSKGGQAANKGSALIRLTHTPSGITVIAEEQRSQKQNKVVARTRLEEALRGRKADAIAKLEAENWVNHNELERGNPVRTFEGLKFVERS